MHVFAHKTKVLPSCYNMYLLQMSNFQFNGKNYLQIRGTAMGTRVAPSYANLFMARLEYRLLANCEYKLPLYLRYIDDIFSIFPYSEADLHKFMHYINNSHPKIKFMEEHSWSEVVFLDTIVKRLDNKLYTDLYTKPTDTHSFLEYTSSHLRHITQNGPYIYILECNKQYVGETKRRFITRFKEHLADIRHNRNTPVAKHYNLSSHKNNTTPVFPLPTILSRIAGHPDRTTDIRKNKEKMWIYTLRSIAPQGINLWE